ncbi:MAG: phage portal protein, partial [Chromatiales bacterium]
KVSAIRARPDYFLTTDGVLKQEQVDMIKDGIDELHRGVSQSHRPGILQGGLKVDQLTLSAEDAQLIATRQFQVADIARIYGVPAHMIGHTEKTTSWGSGVEQLSIGFVKYTLQRHLVNYEQEINRKCLRDRKLFSKFNTAGLERGDIKTRNEAHRIALGRAGEPGWSTVNEVRKLEDMPPIAGGNAINTGNTDEPTAPTTE